MSSRPQLQPDDSPTYWEKLEHDRTWMTATVEVKPLAELAEWDARPGRDVIAHRSGRFFTVEGIRITSATGPVPHWEQPIVVQPEVGVLGIVARRFGGVMHFLMQHKREPGNRNGVQVSPTVQATRSNFTRVHGGAATPYLSFFRPVGRNGSAQRTLVDVRQSEQGSWFLGKRNRNVVVEVFEDVPALPGWHWLRLDELAELMYHDDLVNMEVRSVLACLPPALLCESAALGCPPEIRASYAVGSASAHPTGDLLSWITRARSDHEQVVERRPLSGTEQWVIGDDHIAHESGRYFTVMGVQVTARGREVRSWDQPMVSAGAGGVVGMLVTEIDGVLHVLLRLRAEAGGFDGPEVAPTVQCDPGNYDEGNAPAYLRELLTADPDQVLFDTMLSDEGGRFFRTSHRHLVVRTEDRHEPPGFRWLTLAQCAGLVEHSHYLNVQTRSLLACVHALSMTGRRTSTAPATELENHL